MKKLESIKKSKFSNIEAKKMQEVFGGKAAQVPTEVDTVSTTANNESEGDPTVCDADVPSARVTLSTAVSVNG